MSDASALRDLMVNTKVAALVRPHAIATLAPDSSVEHALATLAAHKVLSAPVIRKATEGGHEIEGFLDVKDIVLSLLASLPPGVVGEKFLLRRMKALEAAAPAFASAPVAGLPVQGGDGSFFLADQAAGMSLLELVHDGFLFPHAKAPHGGERTATGGVVVHRAALHDAACRVTAIISQSDVARFLSTHESALGGLGTKTVADLGWVAGPGSIHAVPPEASALAALALMAEKKVAGVAVVDAGGALLGNMSASDARGLTADRLAALALPVAEFLALEHNTDFWSVSHHAPAAGAAGASAGDAAGAAAADEADLERAKGHATGFARRRRSLGGEVGQDIVAAAPTDTLAAVLGSLVRRRLHRLYVVDGEGRPVGVVTLTDVLRAVAKAAT